MVVATDVKLTSGEITTHSLCSRNLKTDPPWWKYALLECCLVYLCLPSVL